MITLQPTQTLAVTFARPAAAPSREAPCARCGQPTLVLLPPRGAQGACCRHCFRAARRQA